MSDNSRLVYSTDSSKKEKCPKCKELLSECTCEKADGLARKSGYKFVAKLRMEKSGRNGKIVTVIDELPKQEIFLRDLTTELKKKCGSGGTYLTSGKEGVIEIQGDKRDMIRTIFTKKGYNFKE